MLAGFGLVIGTVDKATLPTDLYRRFIRLKKRLLNSDTPNPEYDRRSRLDTFRYELAQRRPEV